MNLRKSHDMSRGFDVFFAMIAGVGTAAALVGFSRGGAWTLFALAAVAGEILIVYGIWIEPRRLVVTRLREPLVTEPSVWITIAFLSDLHAGAFRRRSWYERIAREVEALHPDILILGGDYVGTARNRSTISPHSAGSPRGTENILFSAITITWTARRKFGVRSQHGATKISRIAL